MNGFEVKLISDSLATDGGYLAIADMARFLDGREHRLIGAKPSSTS